MSNRSTSYGVNNKSTEDECIDCWCPVGVALDERRPYEWLLSQTLAKGHTDGVFVDQHTYSNDIYPDIAQDTSCVCGGIGLQPELLLGPYGTMECQSQGEAIVADNGLTTYMKLLQYCEENISFYDDECTHLSSTDRKYYVDTTDAEGLLAEDLEILQLTEELNYVNAVLRQQRLDMLSLQEQIHLVDCQLEEKKELVDCLTEARDNPNGEIVYSKKRTEVQECYYTIGDLPRHIKRTSIELNKTIALRRYDHYPRALTRVRGRKETGNELEQNNNDHAEVDDSTDHVTTV